MCKTDIKAIETEYNGYRFRSRLEARWAVFFDALGVEYQYEPEGFDLGDGIWYLPDFWLPYSQWWVEIKPTIPTFNELEKARRLSCRGRAVFILAGNVGVNEYELYCYGYSESVPEGKIEPVFLEVLLAAHALMNKLNIKADDKPPEGSLDNLFDLIDSAYNEARQARFGKGGA